MQHVPIIITSIPVSGCCLYVIISIHFVMCQLSNAGVPKPTFCPTSPLSCNMGIRVKSSGIFMQYRRVRSSRRFVETMTIRLTQCVTSQRTAATLLREPKIYQYSRTFCISIHVYTRLQTPMRVLALLTTIL
jgi:hypothetical protein